MLTFSWITRIPNAYEEEILYSAFARYIERMDGSDLKLIALELCGKPQACVIVDLLPSGIGLLLSNSETHFTSKRTQSGPK